MVTLLSAQESPFILNIPGNLAAVQTAAFTTGIFIVDMGDFPFRDKVAFTIHYDPAIIAIDTTQGAPGFPGVEAVGSMSIDQVDNSVPGTLKLAFTLINHMNRAILYWYATGSGSSALDIEPDPANSYFSIQRSQVVVLPQVPGDVDNNRSINITDALRIAKAPVISNEDNLSLECADVDGNGIINIIDALIVAQYSVGIITEFPVGKPVFRQVLFINLEKKAGPLDDYTFSQLGELTLSPTVETITENSHFIFPRNSEVYINHQLLLAEIDNGTYVLGFNWLDYNFSWSTEDKAAGRIIMDKDKDLTAYYSTSTL
jgi:hypothetical protein